MKANRLYIETYDYSGNPSLVQIPIVDRLPTDIRSYCAYQRFYSNITCKNIIVKLLFTVDSEPLKTFSVDITSACKDNSYIYLIALKDNTRYTLYVYCDYAHKGTFSLSDTEV